MPAQATGRVVLASGNPGKLREMSRILAGLEVELVPQSAFNVPEVEETGKTFVENAILKARAAAGAAGCPAIADDSGIEVDVLHGEPGVYSARYAGVGASDRENLELLLDRVARTGASRPAARFQCVIVYLRHALDPTPVIASGTWEGFLVDEPRGDNGFGYDPVFYVPDHGCTSAELPPDVKNAISHRGQALQELTRRLTELGLMH